jgi:hypothetical protein
VTTPKAGEDVEKQDSVIAGEAKWCSHVEDSSIVPYRAKLSLSLVPDKCDHFPRAVENLGLRKPSHKCLFIIAKNCKQLRCPSSR